MVFYQNYEQREINIYLVYLIHCLLRIDLQLTCLWLLYRYFIENPLITWQTTCFASYHFYLRKKLILHSTENEYFSRSYCEIELLDKRTRDISGVLMNDNFRFEFDIWYMFLDFNVLSYWRHGPLPYFPFLVNQ